jgi:CBS domain-containing protein
MIETTRDLLTLTAADLMSRKLVLLSEHMSLRDAARLLLRNQIGGAPVVDKDGRCVGVLTAIDFVRLAGKNGAARAGVHPLPSSCPFCVKRTTSDGKEVAVCTLLPGVCPIQAPQVDEKGHETIVCSLPHCVLADWQIVDFEKLPETEVRHYMTANCVTVAPTMSIRPLARTMIDAHVHRAIVVNEEHRPSASRKTPAIAPRCSTL